MKASIQGLHVTSRDRKVGLMNNLFSGPEVDCLRRRSVKEIRDRWRKVPRLRGCYRPRGGRGSEGARRYLLICIHVRRAIVYLH